MRAPRDANAFGFADAPGQADCLTRESCGKKDAQLEPLTFWCDGSQIIAHRGGQRQTLGPVATAMLLDMLRRDWAA